MPTFFLRYIAASVHFIFIMACVLALAPASVLDRLDKLSTDFVWPDISYYRALKVLRFASISFSH